MLILAQHAADGGDPVRHVEEHDDFLQLPAGHVAVHLGQPRHEILAGPVDHGGSLGHDHLGRWAHGHDALSSHYDRVTGQRPLTVHGKDRHVRERGHAIRRRCSRSRARAPVVGKHRNPNRHRREQPGCQDPTLPGHLSHSFVRTLDRDFSHRP